MDGDKAQEKVRDEQPYGKETLESLVAPILTAPHYSCAIIHPYFPSNI